MKEQSVENSKEYPYHVLDPTTPWYEFLQYCEICHQLGVEDQPSVGRFYAYRRYLKFMGII